MKRLAIVKTITQHGELVNTFKSNDDTTSIKQLAIDDTKTFVHEQDNTESEVWYIDSDMATVPKKKKRKKIKGGRDEV